MKKCSLCLLVTFLVLLMPSSSEAANWKWVADSTATVIYMDIESVSGGSAGPKDAWFRIALKEPDCTSPEAVAQSSCVLSAESNTRYFSDKSFCALEQITYYKNGTKQITYYKNTPKSPCTPKRYDPDTLDDTLSLAMWEVLYRPSAAAQKNNVK